VGVFFQPTVIYVDILLGTITFYYIISYHIISYPITAQCPQRHLGAGAFGNYHNPMYSDPLCSRTTYRVRGLPEKRTTSCFYNQRLWHIRHVGSNFTLIWQIPSLTLPSPSLLPFLSPPCFLRSPPSPPLEVAPLNPARGCEGVL